MTASLTPIKPCYSRLSIGDHINLASCSLHELNISAIAIYKHNNTGLLGIRPSTSDHFLLWVQAKKSGCVDNKQQHSNTAEISLQRWVPRGVSIVESRLSNVQGKGRSAGLGNFFHPNPNFRMHTFARMQVGGFLT